MILKWKLQIEPTAKGRPKFSMHNKFPIAYTPHKTRLAESNIMMLMMLQNPRLELNLPQGAIKITMTFVRTRPKSSPKKKPCEWTVRADIDNLFKLICDAMKGIYFRDDSQIVEAHLYKKTAGIGAPPSIEIEMVY